MASIYPYQKNISNGYLGKFKTIKGMSPEEVEEKSQLQLSAWKAQELKVRQREQKEKKIANSKTEAERKTKEVDDIIQNIQNTLIVSEELNPDQLLSNLIREDEFEKFIFQEKLQTVERSLGDEEIISVLGKKPQLGFLASIVAEFNKEKKAAHLAAVKKYEENVTEFREQVSNVVKKENDALKKDWNEKKSLALAEYKKAKEAFYEKQQKSNSEIQRFLSSNIGDESALDGYADWIAELLAERLFGYPDAEANVDSQRKLVGVDVAIPSPDNFPEYKGYKYVQTRDVIEPINFKKGERGRIFDDFAFKVSLAYLSYMSKGLSSKGVESIAVNIWVKYIDKSTGQESTSCILSVFADLDTIAGINFSAVDPKECVRSLKGLYSGNLASLSPVKPIVHLSTEDDRFIESRDVIEELDPSANLAIMDWEDFEYLVRQLFGRIFSGEGSEVKVTQASRDQGVDAIAFDPDPIRGGKYVIQAKRYNNVVGVSAVRDLYGTMLNEGANKGILVTTSYYGNDSINFCKDKPLQLIDGQNLLHLLSQYGYGDFNITLVKGE